VDGVGSYSLTLLIGQRKGDDDEPCIYSSGSLLLTARILTEGVALLLLSFERAPAHS
jgi:hypothetical protein